MIKLVCVNLNISKYTSTAIRNTLTLRLSLQIVERYFCEHVLEHIHDNTGYTKTQHTELQDVPERSEVLALFFLNFLDTPDEEEYRETAIQNFEEDNNNSKTTDVILQTEYL